MTRLLYMDSIAAGYERTFQARVVEALPEAVVLDQTLFYPLGGGQEWDAGTITGPSGAALPVREVTKRGLVRHVVGPGHGLTVGDDVQGAIDWQRRYAHMRMHTAQHLVSGLAYEMFGGPGGGGGGGDGDGRRPPRTVGNQIHAQRSRIDFNPIEFTNQMLADLEDAANGHVRAQRPVTMATMTRGDVLQAQPPERTNMDLLPKSVNELRVIRIGADGEVDLCPCAGTHVANTKEIGELRILSRRSKGQGTQRIEYTLAGLDDGARPDLGIQQRASG